MSVRRADTHRWRSLGTRGAHVEIVEHDPEWPRVFKREAEAILEECRPCITEVHHIGSTSVSGLAAKPVLDMMPVAVSADDGAKAVSRMEMLGYLYSGESGIPGRFYFDRVVDGRTVAHVHMFPASHPDVRKHLVFRDHLRAHTGDAQDYEQLKRSLASKYRDDRRTYTDAKAEFINMIIDTAMSHPAVERAERSSS